MEPLEKPGPLEESLRGGAIVIVRDRSEGLRAINSIAPEHLELFCNGEEEEVFRNVRNAGAVFMGEYATVALGDYTAGTNHVLPTMGWSRRASPLSVRDYLRSREYVKCTRGGVEAIGDSAMTLGQARTTARDFGRTGRRPGPAGCSLLEDFFVEKSRRDPASETASR